MALAGAILAPRFSYMDATVAFNPTTSFLTVIMALLGGATSVWGPMLGVIPLVLISDYLSITLPHLLQRRAGSGAARHRLLHPERHHRPAALRPRPRSARTGWPTCWNGWPDAARLEPPARCRRRATRFRQRRRQPAARRRAARPRQREGSAMSASARPLLEVDQPEPPLRRSRRARRRLVPGRPRRGGGPRRPQRLGQDHAAQLGLRPPLADGAARCVSTASPITGHTPEAICRAGIAGTFQLARIPDALDARGQRRGRRHVRPPPARRRQRPRRGRPPAGPRRLHRQSRRPRRLAHLLRSQAHRARPRARLRAGAAAARRMARRPQPDRAGRRHRPGALAAATRGSPSSWWST